MPEPERRRRGTQKTRRERSSSDLESPARSNRDYKRRDGSLSRDSERPSASTKNNVASHKSSRHSEHSRRDGRTDQSVSPPPKRRRRSPSRSRSPYRRDRSASPPRRRRRDRHSDSPKRSQSPPRRRRDPSSSRSPPPRKRKAIRSPHERSRKPLPDQQVAFRGGEGDGTVDAPIVKEKPNFGNSGLLAKESNTVAGTKIVLKYNEPPEARKPPASQAWRMYIFKGDDLVDTVPLHTRSCWLIGREAAVADLLVEHPSTSKQHAIIQFRHSVKVNEFGDRTNVVRPYLLDLESANGTELNGERLEGSRYFEVRDKDMMKLGLSEREYVFMLPPSA